MVRKLMQIAIFTFTFTFTFILNRQADRQTDRQTDFEAVEHAYYSIRDIYFLLLPVPLCKSFNALMAGHTPPRGPHSRSRATLLLAGHTPACRAGGLRPSSTLLNTQRHTGLHLNSAIHTFLLMAYLLFQLFR